MDIDPTVIAVVVVSIIGIWLLGKAFLGMAKREGKRMTKKDVLQQKINTRARGPDEERWRAVGKSARKAAKKRGGLSKLLLFVIFVIILLALLDAFLGNGEIIGSLLENVGR